jgi:hypothetical protein
LIAYDEKLEIVFNKKVASLAEIEDELIDVFGDVILEDDLNVLNEFERKVVYLNYRLVNGKVYLKRGVPERKLTVNIVDDLFPNGYHISDDTAFSKIQAEYIRRYGFWDDGIIARLIATYLERENFCQIDKGTYMNRKYAVNIPSDLKDEIINYILENQPTVFYESIFKHFKDRLEEIGINNYYYLKGIIDQDLPSEFNTKRNYIQVGTTTVTSSDNIRQYMRIFNSSFSIDDVRSRFEGVKDYTLYSILYSEANNGLIWLSTKEFIFIDKANISEVTLKKLDEFMHGLFETLGTNVMSSRKIFSRLMLTNKPLLEDLKIVDDQFSMFSLLKYLYGAKYYFSRPLISLDKNSDYDQETVVRDYVSKMDKFNFKQIKAYQSKLSLRGLYSYAEFMENMSDDFVQYNIDSMVRKELLNIDDKFIKDFRNTFELIFSKFECVDTRIFNGYMVLPQLDYKWNKYLLVGIIRSYFSDLYNVENTEIFYDKTDFIIRKIA